MDLAEWSGRGVRRHVVADLQTDTLVMAFFDHYEPTHFDVKVFVEFTFDGGIREEHRAIDIGARGLRPQCLEDLALLEESPTGAANLEVCSC